MHCNFLINPTLHQPLIQFAYVDENIIVPILRKITEYCFHMFFFSLKYRNLILRT